LAEQGECESRVRVKACERVTRTGQGLDKDGRKEDLKIKTLELTDGKRKVPFFISVSTSIGLFFP
jgi:hypothetical protein